MCVCARERVSKSTRTPASVRECVWMGGCTSAGCACARVSLLIQYATRRRYIIYVLSRSTTRLRFLTNGTIFGKEVTEHKKFVFISFTPSI